MNNCKLYNVKGAIILAIQNDENIAFYMDYRTSDFIFCVEYKGKLSELEDEEVVNIWREYFDIVIGCEGVLIDYYEKEMERMTNELEEDE